MSGIVNSTGARSGVIGTTVGTPSSGATAGNLVLGDSRDFTADDGDGTTFELASGYDVHVVELENLGIASDNNHIYLRLGTSDSSFADDGYNFTGCYQRFHGPTDTQTEGQFKGIDSLCYFYFMANETSRPLSGALRIYGARNSSHYTNATGHHVYWAQDDYVRNYVWSSSLNPAQDNSHIKIYTSSGNIDMGTVKVYGVKN